MTRLTLISHHLCPFVQRAAIALAEKGVAFERINVDLANKPDWFLAISPLGKVPLLKVGERVIFESAVILEYLEETEANPLHPADPLKRAEHRAWIEFGSTVLSDIWGFYTAVDEAALQAKVRVLIEKFARLEQRLRRRPLFRRRALQPGGRGVRSGVPLFRRLRPDRRFRHPRGQAEGRCLAPGVRRSVHRSSARSARISPSVCGRFYRRGIPGCRP